ncbi:hypothetical protein OQA88_5400 [Cercophora sp. LCS_1]
MSSVNETAQESGSGGGNENDFNELIIAAVALLTSLVALVISVLQALQQYYSSAKGFSSCSKAVIGGWAVYTSRKYRKSEFRFEVRYTAPILFVCPPANTKGPLGEHSDTPIFRIDGFTPEDIHTPTPEDIDAQGPEAPELVHTAENDKADWLELLVAIQRMERESISWQHQRMGNHEGVVTGRSTMERLRRSPWRRGWRRVQGLVGYTQPTEMTESRSTPTPLEIPDRTLIICLQKQHRSWDNMPENLTKPYATTALSHLIEITAMLGIFWKEFNRDRDQYRAQGNGFSIEGFNVDGLGVTFRFRKSGQTRFKENRVIPSDHVKELCFGNVPTIFRGASEAQYTDEPRGMGTLQLGSMSEIGRTLAVFGCSNFAVNYFLKGDHQTRHGAMFPVAFEIVGMVASAIQIRGTLFRMLPNPTLFHWHATESFLKVVLDEFWESLMSIPPISGSNPKTNSSSSHVAELCRRAKMVIDILPDQEESEDLGTLKGGAVAFELSVLERLHDVIEFCDGFLTPPAQREVVRLVLCTHLQEVLDIVNEVERVDLLDQLDEADAKTRPYMLVDLYLTVVGPAVIKIVCDLLDVPHASRSGENPPNPPGTAPSSEGTSGKEKKEEPAKPPSKKLRTGPLHPAETGSPQWKRPPVKNGGIVTEGQIADVWCTLVVRMLCWLLLHDFHAKDAQISKSDSFGSRTPVYLA